MSQAASGNWLRTRFRNGRGRPRRSAGCSGVPKRQRSSTVRFDALEDRALLATIVVNSTADRLFQPVNATVTTEVGSTISLRDAINIADDTPGPNTIDLQRNRNYKLQTIDNYWYGPDGLPAISNTITIDGNGATIERTGGPDFRFFYVSNHLDGSLPDGSLTLEYLTLRGGVAKGGDSYEGGGGLGAGGERMHLGGAIQRVSERSD
jgi:hypothetical protein